MKLLRSALLSCLVLLGVTLSWAAGTTAKISWSAPTTYTDTTALPVGDIDHYTLTWAPASGAGGPIGSMNVPGNLLTAQVPVPCGGTSFTVSVTTGPNAHIPNATSTPTNAVPYVSGIACVPNPPTGLVVQ
jgi:hypothetical protein